MADKPKPKSKSVPVDLLPEEAQLLVQVLERVPAGNREMVALKNGVIAKLLPLLPEDAPVGPKP